MSPLVSWALFLSMVGAFLFYSQKKNILPAPKVIVDRTSVFADIGSGTETGEKGAKKKKEKAKKKKPTPATTSAAKASLSTDDAASHDEDVAEEVNPAEAAKRFAESKNGGVMQTSAGRKSRLAPASPLAAASESSSTGADADIDEEDVAPLSSRDPSDMLEASSGPQVMRITSSQPGARLQPKRAKSSSQKSEAGVHANKNAKKKERAREQKEAEERARKERLDKHLKESRADQSAQARSNKPMPPPPSVWADQGTASIQSGSSHDSATTAQPAQPAASSSQLLDTFSSEDDRATETQMRSTMLSDSIGWEDIPSTVMAEPQWNEVKRKTRKERKAPSTTSGEDEPQPKPKPRPAAPAPTAASARPVLNKAQSSKTSNSYNVLDNGNDRPAPGRVSPAESNSKGQSSDDWSAIEPTEDMNNWDVQ